MPRNSGRIMAVATAALVLGAACAPAPPPASSARLAPIECATPVPSAPPVPSAAHTSPGTPDALDASELSDALDDALGAAEAPGGSGSVTIVSWADGAPAAESVDAASARPVIEAAANDGAVIAVQESVTYTVADTAVLATDPQFDQQWAFAALPFESTWSCGKGAGVRIAVVDTGVQGDHPDLAGRVTAGYRKLGGGPGRVGGNVDPHGHGTHVAGIAAAAANNGIGVAGVAPEVTIMPVRVLSSDGSGFDGDIANGIIWAADNGAHVVNLSLGGGTDSHAMRAAIDHASARGVVVVAAAGNDRAGGRASYPAAIPDVIAVSSIDPDKRVSHFSTRGSYVDVAAPGAGIRSTCVASTYCTMSGTSMAAPHVAALAALVISANPNATLAQLRSRLIDTADDAGPPGFDTAYGHGIINPVGAVTGNG